jgi:hypothetical protein
MMVRMTLASTAMALLLAATLGAQSGPRTPGPEPRVPSPESLFPAAPAPAASQVETPHLRLKTIAPTTPVKAGTRVVLFVDVDPKPMMHVYAPEQKQYMPVSLRLEPGPDATARPPVFPKGETMFFAPLSETQIVYSQPFRIELPVTVARARAAGPLTLTGTLEYQACDDRVCYVPRKVPVAWTLSVR